MSPVLALLLGAALASEGTLEMERARAAVTDERFADARRHARSAVELGAEPAWEAFRVYLDACEGQGLLSRCLGELDATGEPDARTVAAWVRAEQGTAPADPLAGEGMAPDVATLALSELALAEGSPEVAWAMLADADDPHGRAILLRALLVQGRDDEAARRARALMDAHPERPDLLSALWHTADAGRPVQRARRQAISAAVGAIASTDPTLVHRALTLLSRAGEHDHARRAAERLVALGEPRPLGRAPWSAAMREELGRAVALQADPTLPEAGTASEVADIATRAATNLRDLGRAEDALRIWRAARARFDDVELALAEAEMLHRMGRLSEAREVASEAVNLAARPGRGDVSRAAVSEDLGRALLARAALSMAEGRVEDALVDAVVASELSPGPEAWEIRGLVQEELGQADAAFASFAQARAAGASVDGALSRTFTGLGPWDAAADALVAGREVAAVSVLPDAGPPPAGIVAAVGEPIPEIRVETAEGDLLSGDLAGEAVVLAFWASWCAPCQAELPALDRLAARLEAEGVPARVVAVSVDRERGPFERHVRRAGYGSMTVGWSPEAGRRFGVRQLPTTWVIDADGTARFLHTGYAPGSDARLERALRGLLRD